jgi:hypothetical protein
MTDHLFRDIFKKFAFFFHPEEYRETKFLYEISFGFIPRKFDLSEDDKFIYYEENEVPEMYFIVSGSVGIGYSEMMNDKKGKKFKIEKYNII